MPNVSPQDVPVPILRMLPQSLILLPALLAVLLSSPTFLAAESLNDTRELVRLGQYEEALEIATEATQRNSYFEGWPLLKAQIELTLGRWSEAQTTLEDALQRHSWSIQLRWLARDAYRRTGDVEAGTRMQTEILKLAEASPWRFTQAPNLVVLGEVSVALGADAKEVLDAFFERANEMNAGTREPVKAIGQLALDKNDFKLAATTYREGLEQFPDDPDLLYGLAVALRNSKPPEAQQTVDKILAINPKHIPTLLLIADRQIDAEEYESARKTLQQVLDVNPGQDEALAYLAVLAHLKNDTEKEKQYREQALSSWAKNPLVDHVIGKKLSQKYRFKEGVEYQWQALDFDPVYLPARRQAAQDLLRLGEEDQGWKMAASVFADDEYDVTAYNLVTLHDEISHFTTLENDSFLLRMETNEAAIYGSRALELLTRAKETLCAKYGLTLRDQVIVEIFPNPADFEVRTFGMPGVPGFLGVCFGRVITANSPSAQAVNPSNWEAVLWHEFCHVVTLQLTRNRMPRWLSEGISVYEERLADPRWGQSMSPAYRKRILDGELVPIGDLSSAFMTPGSDIQYAYFQSSLVVEFLVDQFGLDALTAVLSDLAEGLPINEALPRHTDEMAALEIEFAEFATQRAEALAPEADWSNPDIAGLLADDNAESLMRDWIGDHPQNVRGLMTFAAMLTQSEHWDEAKEILQRIIDLYPNYVGGESPYLRLAEIHQRLGDHNEEADVLEKLASRDADAGSTFLRLIELATKRQDWEAVKRNSERLMAVNPLTVHPHEGLVKVAEVNGDSQQAAKSYQSLLAMTPDDPAELHYRLARNLHQLDKPTDARRHVLMALESAPRYRDAQRLLLKLVEADVQPAATDLPLLPELAPDDPQPPKATNAF